MPLTSIEIEPNSPANATVIWLHGLGADGHDFEPIVPELNLPPEMAIRFIFPNAPSIPVTINNGYIMPAWYDVLEMSIEREVDEVQLKESAQSIAAFIDREISRGINSERIIIAGFSQGGAVAYQTALTYPKPLAGILGLSTYFATQDSIKVDQANQNIPIQIYHGSKDDVVPEVLGQQSYDKFQAMGLPVNYATYPIEHSVCLEEIDEISKWFQVILG